MPFDPLDHLDASLQDLVFELDPSRRTSPAPPFGYPSTHSGFLKSDSDVLSDMESSTASRAGAGGYSPPAWRRLGNGDRSSGFWRKGDNLLGYDGLPPSIGYRGREFSSPEYDSAEDDYDDDDDTLAAAIRTRLPTGSMSPDKERSPEPDHYRPYTVGAGGRACDQTDVRIKSEEPSMEEMKATLAALPQKDDPENCTSPLSWSYSSLWGVSM